MQKTQISASGVRQVVARARKVNPVIGSYVRHFTNESFGLSVELNNGSLKMMLEQAQDQEKGDRFVSDNEIRAIAASFRPKS